jgi:hypothetical protein
MRFVGVEVIVRVVDDEMCKTRLRLTSPAGSDDDDNDLNNIE